MSLKQNKNSFFGPALIGACLAVVMSVPAAAYLGAAFGDTYNMRVLIYCGLLLWSIIGAISIFLSTYAAEDHKLSLSRVFLWFVSVWLWPLLILASQIKKK